MSGKGQKVVPAKQMKITRQPPPTVVAGQTILPEIEVSYLDENGLVDKSANRSISVEFKTNPTSAVLASTLTSNPTDGVTTFNDLNIKKAATGYKLQFKNEDGLIDISDPFEVIAAAPAKIAVTSSPISMNAEDCWPLPVAYNLLDAYENVAPVSASTTLNLSAAPLEFYTDATCSTAAITSQTLTTGVHSGIFYIKSNVAGTHTLTISSGSLVVGTQPVTVYPKAAGKLVITTSSQTRVAGTCSGAVTLETQDLVGNSSPVDSDRTITLTAGGFTFYEDASCTTPVTTTTIVQGTTTKSFYFKGTIAGTATLAATAPGFSPASQAETITPAAASQLAFKVQPSNTVAGVTMSPSVEVSLLDPYGNLATGSTATVGLDIGTNPSGTATLVGGAKSVATVNGVAVFNAANEIKIQKADTGYTLVASAAGLTSATSSSFNIVAAAVDHLAFKTPAQTLKAGTCSAITTIEAQDAFGNTAKVSAATVLSVAGSGISIFSNNTCTTSIPSLNIAAAGSSANFYFKGTIVGNPIVLTSAVTSGTAATSATQNEIITAGDPAHLTFITSPLTTEAGVCSDKVEIKVTDNWGNDVPVGADSSVSLAANDSATTFFSSATCTPGDEITTTTLTTATNKATFYYKSTKAGTDKISVLSTVTATDSLPYVVSGSQDHTITSSVAHHLSFLVQPTNTPAGTAITPAVKVIVQDAFGNTVTSYGTAITVDIKNNPGAGSIVGGPQSQVPTLGIATFTGPTALAIEQIGTGYTLKADSGTLVQAESSPFNILVGPPARYRILAAATDVTAGYCSSAPVTIQIEDSFGNISPVTASTAITYASNPSGAGGLQFFSNASCTTAAAATLSAGTSSLSFYYKAKTSGTNSLILTLPGITCTAATGCTVANNTQSLNVTADAPYQLAWVTSPIVSPNEVEAGSCSPVVTISSVDQFGNLSPITGSDQTLTLTPSSGSFYSDNTCTTAIDNSTSPLKITTGNSKADLYFMTTVSAGGQFIATAQTSFSGTYAGGLASPHSSTITQTEAMKAAPPDHFQIITQPSDTVAGQTIIGPFTGELRDRFENPASTSTAKAYVNIEAFSIATRPTLFGGAGMTSATTPTNPVGKNYFPATPVQSLWSNAVAGQLIYTGTKAINIQKVGTYTLRLSALGIEFKPSAESVSFNITNAAPSKLAFLSSAQTLVAGTCSGAVTIQSQDTYSNSAVLSTTTTVAPSGTGYTFYSDSSCTTPITTVDITSGTNSATFYFIGTAASAAQALTVTRTAGTVLTAASQNQVITPDVPHHLGYTTPARTVAAGACSSIITLQSQDQYNNASPVTGASIQSLTTVGTPGAADLTFYSDSSCTTSIGTSATILSGASTVNFYAKGTLVGTVDVTAAPDFRPAGTATQTETIIAGALNKIVYLAGDSQTITAGDCSAVSTIELRDLYDNPVSGAPTTVSFGTSDPGYTFYSDASCSTTIPNLVVGTGTTQGSFYFKSTISGIPRNVKTNVGAVTKTAAHNINPAGFTKFAFTNGTSTITTLTVTAGVCQALTVQAQDAFGNPVASNLSNQRAVLQASTADTVYYSTAGCAGGTELPLTGGGDTFPNQPYVIINNAIQSTVYIRNTKKGTYTLSAVDDAITFAGTFTLTVNADVPTHLGFVPNIQTSVAGSPLEVVPLTVGVLDQFNNIATSTASITIAMDETNVNNGTATLSGTLTATAVAGSATFATANITKAGVNYTLKANATGLTKGISNTFDVVAAAPTKVAITSPAHSVTAGQCSPASTVTITDDYGNPAVVTVDTAIDLAGSGLTFYTDATCTTSAGNQVTVPNGSSSTNFYYVPTTSGTISLDAERTTAPVLAGDHQNQTVSPGTAESIAFSTPARTDIIAGVCSGAGKVITIELKDHYGNRTVNSSGSSYTVNFSSLAATTATLYADSTCSTELGKSGADYQVAIANGGSFFNVYVLDDKAESLPLVVTIAENSWTANQTEIVIPATPTKLVYISSPISGLVAGTCSNAVSFQSQDSKGNASPVASNTTVTLGSDASMNYYSDSSCTTPLSNVVLANGTSAGTFYFKTNLAGSHNVMLSATGLTSDTQTETIVHDVVNKLGFKVQPTNTVAGLPITPAVKVEALDQYGNLVSTYIGTVDIVKDATPAGTLNGTTSVGTTAGASSFSDLSINQSGIGYHLTASSGALIAAQSSAFDILSASPDNLYFASAPQSLDVKNCSAATTVGVKDQYGNTTTVSSNTTVQLTATDITFYSDSSCTNVITDTTILSGQGTSQFWFKATKAGQKNITADIAGLTPATQTETIAPGVVSQLAVISTPQTVRSGECSSAIDIESQDADGNTAPATGLISISAIGPNYTFYTDATCTTPAAFISIAPGSSSTQLYFRGAALGTSSITLTAMGLSPSPTQTETIVPGYGSKLKFTTAGQNLLTNECSALTKFKVLDINGNDTTVENPVVIDLTPTLGLTFYSDATCTTPITTTTILKDTPVAGSSEGGFYFLTGNQAGTATTTVEVYSTTSPDADRFKWVGAEDVLSHTVTARAPTKLSMLGNGQTIRVSSCSAAITVQTQDTFNNTSPVTADTTIALSSSHTIQYFRDVNCLIPISPANMTLPAGNSSVSFYIKSLIADTITVSASATVEGNASSDSDSFIITPAAGAALVYTSIPSDTYPIIKAGNCIGVYNVELQDRFGNKTSADMDYPLVLSSSFAKYYNDAACTDEIVPIYPSTDRVVSILTGQSTLGPIYMRTETPGYESTTLSSYSGLENAFDQFMVYPNNPSQLVITSPATSTEAGVCSNAIKIKSKDAYNNDSAPSSDLTVNLNWDSDSQWIANDGKIAFYSDSACTNAVSSITIPSTDSKTEFYIKGTLARSGYFTSISAGALTGATQSQTIVPTLDSGFKLMSYPTSVQTGLCSPGFFGYQADMYDNFIFKSSKVFPSANDPTVTFYSDSACSNLVTSIFSGNLFYMIAPNPGTIQLNFWSGQYTPITHYNVNVGTSTLDKISVITPPHRVGLEYCSPAVTAQLQDASGVPKNVTDVAGLDVNLNGRVTKFYATSDCSGSSITKLNIPKDSNSVSFYYKVFYDYNFFSEKSITNNLTLTTSDPDIVAATQTYEVQHLFNAAGNTHWNEATKTLPTQILKEACTLISAMYIGNMHAYPIDVTVTPSANVSLYSDNNCSTPLTTVHRNPSSNTGYITYYMKAHSTGTASVTYSEPYLNSKTESTWVNDTYLTLSQASLGAGVCTPFDLQSKDYTGALSAVTGSALDVSFKFAPNPTENFSFSGIGAFSDAACTVGISGITLNPGDSTARFYMFDSRAPEKGTLTGSVTDMTRILPLNQTIMVNTGALSKFILWPNLDSVAMGECSTALYLRAADSQGNLLQLPSAISVALSAQTLNASGLPSGTLQPGVKYYSDQNCTNQISSIGIGTNSYNSGAFYMKTNFSAPFAAFATYSGVNSYYLMSSATERLAIVDSPNVPSKNAYVCRPFTVQYQDVVTGDAKNPALPVPIVVSVPPGYNTPSELALLYNTPNCTGLNVNSFEDVINPVPGTPTQGDIQVGVTKTYSIFMKSLAPVDITVTSPGRVTGRSTVETVPPPGSKLIFPTYPTIIEAGVCSGARQYTLVGQTTTYLGGIQTSLVTSDATGNKPIFGGQQTVVDLQSPTIKFYSDTDCNNEITKTTVDPNKQSTNIFFFKSTVAGPNELVGFGQITGDAAGLSGNAIKKVKPSTVYQIGFGSDPQTIRAGDCSEDLSLQVQDRYGNEQVDTVKNEVSFSYPTGFTLYSDSACTNSIATTFIAANQSRKTIWFRHTTAGDVDVTPVPVRQLEGITQTEKILSGAASFLRFTNAPLTVPKGTCSSAATLQIQDFNGNTVPASGDAVVNLLGDAAFGMIFYSDSDCNLASAISSVTIPNGQTSKSFYFIAHTEGQAQITAKSTGLVDAKQKESITAGIPVKLSFLNPSLVIGAGSCSKQLTVEVQDAYGDTSAALANTTLSLSGTNATFYSDQNCTSPIVSLGLNSGQSSKTFYALSTVAGSLDITVADNALGTLTQAVQMETIVPASMSATTFLTSASTLPVGKCSAATKLGVKDRYGNPTTPPDRYTLLMNLTGPTIQFFSDSQCSTVLSGAQVALKSGDPYVSFYYLSNSIGSRTISVANTANLDTTSQVETFTASSPTKLGFITPSRNVSSGQCSQIITFATMDPMSNETNADQDYNVTLTPPAGAQFYSTSNCAGGSEISTATITSGTSRTDVYLKVPTVAGTYSLSISDGTLTGANQNVTVGGGAPAKLAFTSAAQTGVVIQTCSALTTFGFKDASDNTTVASGNTAVSLSSADATFYSDAACSNSITTVNVGTGQSGGSFYFKPSQVGTVAVQISSGGLTSATQNETAVAGAATKLVFTSAPQTFIAGTCKTATLQTQDNLSNPAISASIRTITLAYSGSAPTFYTSGDCSGGSTSTLSLPANNSSITFSYKITASGTSNFTGSSSGLAQATQTQTINPDTPVTLAFATSARTVTAGVCSPNVVIQSRDAFANPSALGADKTVSLAGLPLHFYSDSGCSNEITTIDIVNGTHSSTFYFKSTTSGALPLGISTAGLTSANQTETVNPDVPTKLAYLNSPLNITAGTCAALSMQVQDQYNNPSAVGSSTTITYQLSGTTAAIYSDSGCTNSISSQVLASGHSFTAYFKSTLSGSTTVRISAPSIAFADQTETMNPGAATHIAFTTTPFTLNAGQCSGDIGPATVQVQDALGNAVPVGAATAFNLSGSGYTFYSDNTCTTTVTSLPVTIGNHTASFYFKSTTAGTSALTVAMSGFTSINQNQTINALGLSRVGFSISSPTFATTVCTAVTVQTQDTYGNPVIRAQNTNVNLSVTSGTLSIYSNSGCTTATSSAVVPSGSASAPTIYVKTNVSGSPVLTATDAGAVLSSSNLNLTVTAGTPTKIAFTTGAQSITANTCSGAITIQAQDANSNPATLTATRTVNLTVSPVVASGLLFYSDASCSSQITSINMNTGVQSVNVYAKSLKTNTYTLTADPTGWTMVSQNMTVNAGAVSAVAVTAGAAQPSLKAGLCSAAVTIETRDAQANPTKPASNMNFNLTGTNLSFFSDAGCTASITQTTVLSTGTTSTFYYKGTILGSYTININGTVSTTATTTIVPGTPTTLKIVAPITAIHTDTCSTAFTVRTMDSYNNYSTVSSSQVVALSVSPSLGQLYSDFGCVTPLSPEQITVASGTSTSANFFFKNTTVEPVVTLTAQLAGYTSDSKNVAVSNSGPRIELYEYTSNSHIASGGSFDYGVATVDTPQSFYIKNNGTTVTGSLTVQLVADPTNPTPVGSATMWTLQTDMCSGQTLAAGATCLITVKFNAQTGSKPAGDYYYGNIRVQSTPKADGDGSIDVQVLGIKQ